MSQIVTYETDQPPLKGTLYNTNMSYISSDIESQITQDVNDIDSYAIILYNGISFPDIWLAPRCCRWQRQDKWSIRSATWKVGRLKRD